jgi:hypothetical protein
MTATQATAEVFWTAFRALPKKEREAVLERLLRQREIREDLIDIALIQQRQKEPSRRLEDYLEERKRKGS